jgi:hypothetical protein
MTPVSNELIPVRVRGTKWSLAYSLPNDGVEQERLDLQHYMFLLLLNGKLAMAPFSAPRYVLDIGTGRHKSVLRAFDFPLKITRILRLYIWIEPVMLYLG